jgi:hypothetical protein
MTAWGRLVCLACVGATLLVPQAASAKPGYYVTKPWHAQTLHLKGSNGFDFMIFSLGARRLGLVAARFDRAVGQSVTYNVPRLASGPDEIRASLGKLGRIALRFRPSGPPRAQREPGGECKGRDATQQTGVFTGTLRFRGELGFTTVRTSSARGHVFHSFKQVCRRPQEKAEGGPVESKAVSLSAYIDGSPEKASFSAYEFGPESMLGPESTSYSASVSERRGQMSITRSTDVFAEPSTFMVGSPTVKPATAAVAPPPPFAGTATFDRGAGKGHNWNGDLSVNLPGRGSVSLAGPPFTARLCQSLACACPPGTQCAFFFTGIVRVESGNLPRRLDTERLRLPLHDPVANTFWDTGS